MTKEELKWKEYVAAEVKAAEEVDIDKYFKACLNGAEAYHAVYLLHKFWSETKGDPTGYYQTIMASMLMHVDKEEDWALCVKRVIDGRKPGMRNYLKEEGESITGSCTCNCNCIKREQC